MSKLGDWWEENMPKVSLDGIDNLRPDKLEEETQEPTQEISHEDVTNEPTEDKD